MLSLNKAVVMNHVESESFPSAAGSSITTLERLKPLSDLSDKRIRTERENAMVYTMKRYFSFKNSAQAEAFLEIANIYGKGRVFGQVVIYEATLEFAVWRKLENLAKMVSECPLRDIDIYKMTSQAGFKAFRKVSQ